MVQMATMPQIHSQQDAGETFVVYGEGANHLEKAHLALRVKNLAATAVVS